MVSRPNQLDKGWQKEGLEWYRGSANEQRIIRISWCCCRQLATGNWRLVKKGIRTQLEGSNNVQRTRTIHILLCARAKGRSNDNNNNNNKWWLQFRWVEKQSACAEKNWRNYQKCEAHTRRIALVKRVTTLISALWSRPPQDFLRHRDRTSKKKKKHQ